MSTVSVLNVDAGISGKTLVNAEDTQTVTGSKTFDLDPGAPFAVTAGSAVVTNLDADKVDGNHASAFALLSAQLTAADGAVGAPEYSFASDPDTGIYRSGANALDFSTNSTKALGIDSTQFIDSPTQPRAVAYNNAVQSVNNATLTAAILNAEDIDVGSMHDNVTNNSRMTIPTGGDGLYLVMAKAFFAGSGVGVARIARITKNGAAVGTQVTAPPNANNFAVPVFGIFSLVATDYIELYVYQDSGGNLNVSSAARQDGNEVSIVKLW